MSGVDESLVTPAVVALLRAQMACPIGHGEVPNPTPPATRLDPDVGFVVVTVVPIGAAYAGDGYLDQPDSIETIRYQLTATGRSQNHASLLAHTAAGIVCDRAAGGAYVHALAVAGHAVLRRWRAGRTPDAPGPESWSSGRLVNVQAHADA